MYSVYIVQQKENPKTRKYKSSDKFTHTIIGKHPDGTDYHRHRQEGQLFWQLSPRSCVSKTNISVISSFQYIFY